MTELNAKELKLLRLICNDHKNAEMADELGYGLRYLEKLKSALYKKTRTHSGVGLLKWAVLNGYYTIRGKSAAAKSRRR